MKFLIVDTYYANFLNSVYNQETGLADRPYDEQWRVLMDQCFGTADFCSANLRQIGHEIAEVVVTFESVPPL